MTYPQDLEVYRKWLSGFDYLHASDLADLLSSASLIQSEMGILPSGEHGTVSARLFENGNLSQSAVGWQRLLWSGNKAASSSTVFSHRLDVGGGFRVDFDFNRFRGQHSSFGEDTPTPFGSLQGPVTTTFGDSQRRGVPWRSMIARVESNSDLDQSFCEWIAMDGEGGSLLLANSTPCRWGYMIWNLIT